jgi:hypothetical protein
MNLLLLPIVVAATILTYVATYHALRTSTTIESPRPIAAMVALLTGVSLLALGQGIVALILIPYAALGLSLLFLLLSRLLRQSEAGRELKRWLEDSWRGPSHHRPSGDRTARNLKALDPTPPYKPPPTEN